MRLLISLLLLVGLACTSNIALGNEQMLVVRDVFNCQHKKMIKDAYEDDLGLPGKIEAKILVNDKGQHRAQFIQDGKMLIDQIVHQIEVKYIFHLNSYFVNLLLLQLSEELGKEIINFEKFEKNKYTVGFFPISNMINCNEECQKQEIAFRKSCRLENKGKTEREIQKACYSLLPPNMTSYYFIIKKAGKVVFKGGSISEDFYYGINKV